MDSGIKELLKNSNKVMGLRQVLRGVRKGQIGSVLLALDADENIKLQVQNLCNVNNMLMFTCESKEELGKELQIDRACAVVGFLK